MPALNASGGPGYAHAGTGDKRQHYAQIGFSAWDGELSSAPVTVTIGIAAQADVPTLSLLGDTGEANGVGLNHGLEDLTIALQTLVAGLTDMDGSEQLVLTLTGLPPGSVLSDGAVSSMGLAGHRFMPSDSQHVVNLAGWRLDALQLTPPPNFSGAINLAVQATDSPSPATASPARLASCSKAARSPTTPAPSTWTRSGWSRPLPRFVAGSGPIDSAKTGGTLYALAGNPVALPQANASLNDLDGSEQLKLELLGLPAGSILSDGTRRLTANAGNAANPVDVGVDLVGWNTATLSLQPPANFTGTLHMTLRATVTESSNGQTASATAVLNIIVLPGKAVATPVGLNPYVSLLNGGVTVSAAASPNLALGTITAVTAVTAITTMAPVTSATNATVTSPTTSAAVSVASPTTAPSTAKLAATSPSPAPATVPPAAPTTWAEEEATNQAKRQRLSDAWLRELEAKAQVQWRAIVGVGQ